MADRATPAEAVLTVEDLSVSFVTDDGVVRALENLSFEVLPGRTVGIVGESGCGKSVTARAILRIEDRNARITSGRVILRTAGVAPRDLLALKASSREMRAMRGRDIALIFQEPMTSFSPVHTIGSQIVEAIRLHNHVPKKEAKAQAIDQLTAVGAPHPEYMLSRYVWELSGGLRQRAMIAMALVCGPRLLIADEPTTALDVTSQAQVLTLLKHLQKERAMALILITHDLGVVAETADDVVVMYLGQAIERGPVREVLRNPRHPYTRALMRSMPDISARPRERLETLRGSVPHPLHRPPACAFHTRCRRVMPGICDVTTPRRIAIGATEVRCHLHDPKITDPALAATWG